MLKVEVLVFPLSRSLSLDSPFPLSVCTLTILSYSSFHQPFLKVIVISIKFLIIRINSVISQTADYGVYFCESGMGDKIWSQEADEY